MICLKRGEEDMASSLFICIKCLIILQKLCISIDKSPNIVYNIKWRYIMVAITI